MSTFKGTPGPWEAVNGTDIFTPLAARNGAGTAAHESDGWYIADCSMGETQTEDGSESIPHREQLANAHLIAAAPELLEAAQEVAQWVNQRPATHPYDAFKMLEAAIAKATGGDA